jgi:hypothetical protein
MRAPVVDACVVAGDESVVRSTLPTINTIASAIDHDVTHTALEEETFTAVRAADTTVAAPREPESASPAPREPESPRTAAPPESPRTAAPPESPRTAAPPESPRTAAPPESPHIAADPVPVPISDPLTTYRIDKRIDNRRAGSPTKFVRVPSVHRIRTSVSESLSARSSSPPSWSCGSCATIVALFPCNNEAARLRLGLDRSARLPAAYYQELPRGFSLLVHIAEAACEMRAAATTRPSSRRQSSDERDSCETSIANTAPASPLTTASTNR